MSLTKRMLEEQPKLSSEVMEKLCAVVVDRFKVQENNTEDKREDGSDYSNEELVAFAIEEAWQNGELDFLAAQI